MSLVRICDLCGSQKNVKIIGFRLSNGEDDYEENDICDSCELTMLRRFKHDIIEEVVGKINVSKYNHINRLKDILDGMTRHH